MSAEVYVRERTLGRYAGRLVGSAEVSVLLVSRAAMMALGVRRGPARVAAIVVSVILAAVVATGAVLTSMQGGEDLVVPAPSVMPIVVLLATLGTARSLGDVVRHGLLPHYTGRGVSWSRLVLLHWAGVAMAVITLLFICGPLTAAVVLRDTEAVGVLGDGLLLSVVLGLAASAWAVACVTTLGRVRGLPILAALLGTAIVTGVAGQSAVTPDNPIKQLAGGVSGSNFAAAIAQDRPTWWMLAGFLGLLVLVATATLRVPRERAR